MKRLMNWLIGVLAVICMPTLLGGTTDGSWVRADVYATTSKKSHDLVVLPAWIWSRANVLSIYPSLEGKSELKYVTPQHRVVKIEVDLPEDVRQVMAQGRFSDFILDYRFSRTTRTIHSVNANGGYVYCVIEGKKDDVKKVQLQGIEQKGMVPDICTLVPRDGKIVVLFHRIGSVSPHYYLGAFEAASGRLCSALVPVEGNVLAISLLWLDDSTLASTAVGRNGGFWSILSLKTGKVLASGSNGNENSNFMTLPEGLYVTNNDKVFKCLYRIQ